MYRNGGKYGSVPSCRRKERQAFCPPECGDYDPSAVRRSAGTGDRDQIAAEHILRTKQKLNEILAANTGQSLETIKADTERDNFMSADEAKAYGLIDEVIAKH